MSTTTVPYWIVISWVTMDGLAPTGRNVLRDGILRPEFVAAPLAKACTWIMDSSDPADLEKARAYAAANKDSHCIVTTYDESEEHPLQKARAAALKAYKP